MIKCFLIINNVYICNAVVHPPAIREVKLFQHVKEHRKPRRRCDFQVCECKSKT